MASDKYRKQKWETHLIAEENTKAENLRKFLYQNKITETKTKYCMTKYVLQLSTDILLNENLIKIMELLYDVKLIKIKSLSEALKYAILLGTQQIINEIGNKNTDIFGNKTKVEESG